MLVHIISKIQFTAAIAWLITIAAAITGMRYVKEFIKYLMIKLYELFIGPNVPE